MKVLYISNSLTHYYNLVLSRLNKEPDIELVIVVPMFASVGDGVYQTNEGINFRVIQLKEVKKYSFYNSLEGLAKVLIQEQPDVVIVIFEYLRIFQFDVSVILAMRFIRADLILKSIPFRYSTYQEALNAIAKTDVDIASLSPMLNIMLKKTGLMFLVRRSLLVMQKIALNIPDAHVNYVEAYEYWSSYGVVKEKLFITRNSPDTDMLLTVKEEIKDEPLVLSPNPFRVLHVGRLVEWKQVDMLIKAFARVRKSFPESELLIIGTGPEEANLKKIVSDLSLGASVRFLGGVYDQRLLGHYSIESSLYVLAGMGGLSINDAMCFGLPVLCSVADGTEKFLVREGVNGRYFRDGDEDDLFLKISELFDNPTLLKEMGRHSEQIIRHEVNIHTVIKSYVDALNYVFKHKKSNNA